MQGYDGFCRISQVDKRDKNANFAFSDRRVCGESIVTSVSGVYPSYYRSTIAQHAVQTAKRVWLDCGLTKRICVQ